MLHSAKLCFFWSNAINLLQQKIMVVTYYIYIYTILQFWKLCCISISPINTQQWIKKEYCCCTEVSHLTFNFINVINLNTSKRTRRKKWILSTKLIGISNFPLTRMLRYIMKRFIADHNNYYIQKIISYSNWLKLIGFLIKTSWIVQKVRRKNISIWILKKYIILKSEWIIITCDICQFFSISNLR